MKIKDNLGKVELYDTILTSLQVKIITATEHYLEMEEPSAECLESFNRLLVTVNNMRKEDLHGYITNKIHIFRAGADNEKSNCSDGDK